MVRIHAGQPSDYADFNRKSDVFDGIAGDCPKPTPNETEVSECQDGEKRVKFPKRLSYRGRVLATIYGKTKNRPFYRLYWQVRGADGKMLARIREFASYGKAAKEADKVFEDLKQGSPVTALTPAQGRDAMLALGVLQDFKRSTGREVSLHEAASLFCAASSKLAKLEEPPTLPDAVTGFVETKGSLKRKDLAEAVKEFADERDLLTKAENGERPELSPGYAYNTRLWLEKFAGMFPNTAVCDLTRDHLSLYVKNLKQASPKPSGRSLNHYRATVRLFLRWCAKERDYLNPAHRLFDAGGMKNQTPKSADTDFYRPSELKAMLERASAAPRVPVNGEEPERDYRALLPVIALCGLAGLRLEEALRVEWADVWRTPGHVEVKAEKSKTRSRRLVETCSALALWLQPFKEKSGPLYALSSDTFHEALASLRDELKIPARRNGLRHAFCTYHFAMHANENLTAQQAGNSPAMVHQHYKGLAPKKEGEAWFAVAPIHPENVLTLADGRQRLSSAC